MSVFDVADTLKRAREFRELGQPERALLLLNEARQAHPDDNCVLLEHANVLSSLYRIGEACELIQSVRQRAEEDIVVSLEVAGSLARAFRLEEAIRVLEAVPIELHTATSLVVLATYCEQLGRFTEAEHLIQQSFGCDPEFAEAKLMLARLLATRGELSLARQQLEKLVNGLAETQQPRMVVRALYQLAAVLDLEGDFEQAVQRAIRAKAIQKTHPSSLAKAQSAFSFGLNLGEIYKGMFPETIDRWSAVDFPPLPFDVCPAHLIGFPRSGTTLLEQIMDAHPDLTASSETMLFRRSILGDLLQGNGADTSPLDAVEQCSYQKLCELRQRYIRLISETHRGGLTGKVHLDKEPANIQFLFGLLRVVPESKFLVALRDPRDVVVSNFLRFVPDQETSACFLSWGSTCTVYGQCMEIWLFMRNLMLPESWLEVRYEDLCMAAPAQAERAFRFLGLDVAANTHDHSASTKGKHINSPSSSQVRKPVTEQRVARWKNYEKHLGPYLNALQPFVAALEYD